MGAQPGGSITTRKVTRAEMNSSAMAAALDAFRHGEALPQVRGDQRVAQQHRDGHWPHPARHRSDCADMAHRVGEIDVADQSSEEHPSELQSLMRSPYAVFSLQ